MTAFLELVTASSEDTRSLARALSPVFGPGDVISLTGDLGAGKTTFVQGAAQAMGVDEPVLSPTFTLVREYRGPVPVYHLDVYRLDRLQEVLDLGFDELLDSGGVVFVEWGDVIEALLPTDFLQIELTLPEDGDARRLGISWRGDSWFARWERLAELAEPWRAA